MFTLSVHIEGTSKSGSKALTVQGEVEKYDLKNTCGPRVLDGVRKAIAKLRTDWQKKVAVYFGRRLRLDLPFDSPVFCKILQLYTGITTNSSNISWSDFSRMPILKSDHDMFGELVVIPV